jgi:CheY-like chemotaxis protein
MSAQQKLVLLVEDDPNDVVLIERALRRGKVAHRMMSVRNGEEAIHYLAGQGIYADRGKFPLPEILVLDVRMPRRTGFEVLEWLNTRRATKDFQVIVLSSSKEASEVKLATRLGADAYVRKTADFGLLVKELQGSEENVRSAAPALSCA